MAEGPEIVRNLDDFTCPVCLEIFSTPMKIQCGHTFCQACVKKLGAVKDDHQNSHCPECRAPFEAWNVKPDVAIRKKISSCQAQCDGCSKILKLRDLRGHMGKCAAASASETKMFKPIAPTKQQIPMNVPNRSTFTCPYCAEKNFDLDGLRSHCNQSHQKDTKKVVCPVCASMPWGDPDLVSAAFISHINNRHRFEYETYVDYGEDEDETLRRVLAESAISK